MQIKFIDTLRVFFIENSACNIEDVCLVGSSALAAYNLRENSDIDIICIKAVRQQILTALKSSNYYDKIELVKDNWSFFDETLADQEIIENSNNHFIFDGFKVIALDILYKRKEKQSRPKDKKDILLMDRYFDKQRKS